MKWNDVMLFVVLLFANALIESHLLFVDYCFMFFRARESEVVAMNNILATYEQASKQMINL